MPRPSLRRVEILLRCKPDAGALQDVAPIISRFLGPPPTLSLAEACAIGSIQFLDWVWQTSTDPGLSGWSLMKLVQSDTHYRQYQFVEAMKVAVVDGDLEILKWLMLHFPDSEVAVEVVELAAEKGKLAVLKVLLAQSQGIDAENGETSGSGASTVVRWGGHSVEYAIRSGHVEVVRWLLESTDQRMNGPKRSFIVMRLLDKGEMELVKMLLPRGGCVLDYAQMCPRPGIIEWNYECGYLRRNKPAAATAIMHLVGTGQLELMKKISEQHEPSPDCSNWHGAWRDALDKACSCGDLPQLRWLVEHPAGRRACEDMHQLGTLFKLLCAAAARGDVTMMQYLYDQAAVDTFGDALLNSIRHDRLEAMKWVLDHFPRSEHMPDYCVLVEAARHGRLEMLEYLQSMASSVVPGFSPPSSPRLFKREDLRLVAARDGHLRVSPCVCAWRSEWRSTDAMDEAAANGQLQVVTWLHSSRTEGCTTNAMDEAAANGFLEIVQWLHVNRSEGCTTNAIDYAARNGHVEVVEWLDENRAEAFTSSAIEDAALAGNVELVQWLHTKGSAIRSTKAMNFAAYGGHVEMMKWLRANRPGECSGEAIVYALCQGHLRAAYWLHDEFPEHTPVLRSRLICGEHKFAIVLFLHAHYPHVFTPEVVGKLKSSVLQDAYATAWLEENYLSPSSTRLN